MLIQMKDKKNSIVGFFLVFFCLWIRAPTTKEIAAAVEFLLNRFLYTVIKIVIIVLKM